jgi:RNA polymerase sigma factor (TIGR02999 family)
MKSGNNPGYSPARDKLLRSTKQPKYCPYGVAERNALYRTLRKYGTKTVMPDEIFSINSRGEGEGGRSGEDCRAWDHLFSVAYEELRRLAYTVRKRDRSATMTPTALVNEAWLKLARSPALAIESELHFKRIAARAMRQLLVEAARRRNANKRGGEVMIVTLDESSEYSGIGEKDILALDAALDELARTHPRQALVVESRFFGGLETSEIAAQLNVSEATILRDWRVAKAWLAAEVRRLR